MSKFKRYLEEAEYAARHPVPGDLFGIQITALRLVEYRVIEILSDGFVLESLEDMRGERDSISPVHGREQDDTEDEDEDITGQLSPIHGHAFTDYDVNKDPRKWFTKKGQPDPAGRGVNMMGVPGPLSEHRIYLRMPDGTNAKTKYRFIN